MGFSHQNKGEKRMIELQLIYKRGKSGKAKSES
jgi:hypothetical protein